MAMGSSIFFRMGQAYTVKPDPMPQDFEAVIMILLLQRSRASQIEAGHVPSVKYHAHPIFSRSVAALLSTLRRLMRRLRWQYSLPKALYTKKTLNLMDSETLHALH
jgi:hypothetical protein